MAMFSGIRTSLYQYAAQQEPNKLVNLSTTPDHLVTMLFERTGGKYLITCGDVVDHLAPSFDEAKRFGVQRVFTFNKAVKKRWSRDFGPFVKVDRLIRKTI